MKKMMLILVLNIFFISLAFSSDNFLVGNELYNEWQNCKRFINNINDPGMSISNVKSYGILAGYVLGVSDSVNGTLFEVPQGVTRQQIVLIIGRYLEDYPERRHFTAASLVKDALMKAFPKKDAIPINKTP